MNTTNTKITDFNDILAIIAKRRWLILIPWVLIALIAWGGSYLLTPKYESFAIVSIDPNIRITGDLQRFLGLEREFRTTGQQQASILKGLHNEITSTRYISLIDQQLKLSDDPKIAQAAQRAAARQQRAGVSVSADLISMTMIQNELKDDVEVTFAGEDQIRISAISKDQVMARDIANALADVFIDERLKFEMSSIRSSQDFSDVQLQKYEKELSDLIAQKTEFERQYLQAQSSNPALMTEANRNEVNSELERNRNDIQDYQEAERDALTALASVSGLQPSRITLMETEEIGDMRQELKREVESYGSSLVAFTWNDPQMVNSRLKQNSLVRNLEVAARRQVDGRYTEFDEAARREIANLLIARINLDYCNLINTNVESSAAQLGTKFRSIPEYQAELNRLQTEVAHATELRDKFKQQLESSDISQALMQDVTTGKYRKVEPAKLALAPFFPNRLKIVLMGVLLGLVLGSAAALLAELFDNSFKRVEDVQEYLGLPVLGVMPKMEILRKVTH